MKRRDHKRDIVIDNTGFNVNYWGRYYIYAEFETKCIENGVFKNKREAVRKELFKIAFNIIFGYDTSRNAETIKRY